MAHKTRHHTIRLPNHEILVESHAHGPGFKVERHEHSCHSLIHVVSGRGLASIGRVSYDLSPGHTVLIRSGRAHELIDAPDKPMVVFVVYFASDLVPRNRRLFEPISRLTVPQWMTPPRARRVRQVLRQMLHEQQRRAIKYEAAIHESLCSILIELHRVAEETSRQTIRPDSNHRRSRQRVRTVVDYLTDHFFEHCSVVEAARMAGLSQRRFRTVFREITGQGFSQYVNHLRISRAAALLEETEMPVSAIAFEAGYEELSTFYRAFRRSVGVSPLSYRSR